MSLTPPINVTGVYTLANPFATDVAPNTPYTNIAVRKFADVIRRGEDPFALYYDPKGIDYATYQADLNAGECIVTLRSAAGQFIYVPTPYILSFPNQSGIAYTVITLAVNLGAIPNTADLSVIRQKMSDVVHDYYGVTPTIQQVAISETVTKSAADHAAVEAARQAEITERQTDYAKYLQAQATVQAQAQQINQLENYIKANLPP